MSDNPVHSKWDDYVMKDLRRTMLRDYREIAASLSDWGIESDSAAGKDPYLCVRIESQTWDEGGVEIYHPIVNQEGRKVWTILVGTDLGDPEDFHEMDGLLEPRSVASKAAELFKTVS